MTRKEISKYIRHLTPRANCKCEICKSHKDVQTHHLIKVENLTHIAWHNALNTREEIQNMYKPTASLCSECHNNLHALMEENYLEPCVTYDTFYEVLGLLEDIDLSNVDDTLYEDYRTVVDTMTNNVIFNLIKYGDFSKEELETIETTLEQLNLEYEYCFEEMEEII